MNIIYWLVASKPYRHISYHYVLKINEKFMVFTTSEKNLPGIIKTPIANVTLEGKPGIQYIYVNVHKVDTAAMKFELYEKGVQYITEHSASIQPLIEKLITL